MWDGSSSSFNNTCVTVCGDMSSYSYNNACFIICGNVSNSSCNNVVSIVCRSEVVKVTTCEMLSSNHYTTGHCTVGVDSTPIVNVPPKLTTILTSTPVNISPHMAAVCHLRAIVPPETMPACCLSGTASKELEVHDLVDPTIVSAHAKVDVNRIELHDLSDEG